MASERPSELQIADEVYRRSLTAFTWEDRTWLAGLIRSAIDAETKRLREAIQEISECRGEYSLDPLTHAKNVIRWVKEKCDDALKVRDAKAQG